MPVPAAPPELTRAPEVMAKLARARTVQVIVTSDETAWLEFVPLDMFDRYGFTRLDGGADLSVTIAMEVRPLSQTYANGRGGTISCPTGAEGGATLTFALPSGGIIDTVVVVGMRKSPSGVAVLEQRGLAVTCGANPTPTRDLLKRPHVALGVLDLLDRMKAIGSDVPSSRTAIEEGADLHRKRGWTGLDRLFGTAPTRAAALEAVVALLRHDHPDVWHQALVRLQVAPEPRALDARIAALTDRDRAPSVARSFATHPHARAFEPLVAGLAQLDNSGVEGVAVALGAYRDPRAVAPLLASLGRLQLNRDSVAFREVIFALCKFPREAATIRPGLADRSPLVRAGAARALGCIQDRMSIPALVPLLRDADDHSSEGAAVALGQLGGDQATHALIEILPIATPALRETALRGLGVLGIDAKTVVRDARVYDALLATLAQDTLPESTRADAAVALGRLGDPRAIQPLIAALATPFVAGSAADALAMLPPEPRALEPLLRVLDFTDPRDGTHAVKAIGRIPGARATEILLGIVRQGKAFARDEAVSALRNRREPRLREALVAALGDTNWSVREWAANGMGGLGDRAGTPALLRALSDSDWHVVAAAASALGKLRDATAAPALLALWKRSARRGAAAISDVCHWSLVEIAGRDLGKSPGAWEGWKP